MVEIMNRLVPIGERLNFGSVMFYICYFLMSFSEVDGSGISLEMYSLFLAVDTANILISLTWLILIFLNSVISTG